MKYVYLFFFVLLSACKAYQSAQHPTPLTNRYALLNPSVEKSDDDRIIDVTPIVIPAEVLDSSKPGGKAIFDLQSNGQKALIEAFVKKDPDGQKRLSELLNAKYQAGKEGVSAVVKKEYSLVFSTSMRDFYNAINGTLSEGDRISKLRITVTIPAADRESVKFLKWDKYITQFAQFNIGGNSFNVAKQATLNPSVSIGTVSVSAGSIGNAATYQENDSLQLRFVLLTGTLTDDMMMLDQSGTPQIDLQGNTSVAITAAFPFAETPPVFLFEGLQNSDADFQPPAKVTVKESMLSYPALTHDINLQMRVDYVLRHIVKGFTSFTEGDDTISYYWGHFTNPAIPFVQWRKLAPKTWYVTDNVTRMGLYDDVARRYYELAFSSYEDANDFLLWVDHVVRNTVGDKIKLGKYILTSAIDLSTHPFTPTYLTNKNVGNLGTGVNP